MPSPRAASLAFSRSRRFPASPSPGDPQAKGRANWFAASCSIPASIRNRPKEEPEAGKDLVTPAPPAAEDRRCLPVRLRRSSRPGRGDRQGRGDPPGAGRLVCRDHRGLRHLPPPLIGAQRGCLRIRQAAAALRRLEPRQELPHPKGMKLFIAPSPDQKLRSRLAVECWIRPTLCRPCNDRPRRSSAPLSLHDGDLVAHPPDRHAHRVDISADRLHRPAHIATISSAIPHRLLDHYDGCRG